jgi:hypothetical protein
MNDVASNTDAAAALLADTMLHHTVTLQLLEFWVETPADCFASLEGKFYLKSLHAKAYQYECLVAALPRASVLWVLDLLEQQDAALSYTCLKDHLLCRHEPTSFQHIKKLHKMKLQGDCTRANMMEVCPQGPGKQYVLHFRLPSVAAT